MTQATGAQQRTIRPDGTVGLIHRAPTGYDTDDGSSDYSESGPAWVFGIRREERRVSMVGASDSDQHYVVLDSGSDEHVCPVNWHSTWPTTQSSRNAGPLLDVHSRELVDRGSRRVELRLFDGEDGRTTFKAASDFTVCEGLREAVWSAGRIVKAGGTIHLTKQGSWMELGGRWTPVEIRGNRFITYYAAHRSRGAIGAVTGQEQGAGGGPLAPIEEGDMELEEAMEIPEEEQRASASAVDPDDLE